MELTIVSLKYFQNQKTGPPRHKQLFLNRYYTNYAKLGQKKYLSPKDCVFHLPQNVYNPEGFFDFEKKNDPIYITTSLDV